MIEVKRYLTKYLITFLAVGLFSCKDNKVQTVFESNQQDSATNKTALKIYILKKKSLTSDFQYSKLDDIDDNIQDTLNANPVFEPISGKFTYYKFIATFKGYSFHDKEVFHDILIIKTDESDQILDAYQYTLEWAEPPCQYDLYKMTDKNLKLTDNMNINSLKLKRTYYWSEKDEFSNDSGAIRLK
jgi:hypothetical protein